MALHSKSRNKGLAIVQSPEGTAECDTYTCAHCQLIREVPTGQSPMDTGGKLCLTCMKLICHKQACHERCIPWQKSMEAAEAKDRALRSYGV